MEIQLPFFEIQDPEPIIIILSGTSGAGKDSVIKELKQRSDYQFHFIVTCNTRKMRPGEIDGIDYHFISREKFKNMIDNGEMIEYSPVYDDYKGVPKFEMEKGLADSRDMLLRLDIQGTEKVKKFYPNSVSIFVVPPDPKTWFERLINRGGDTEEELRHRIETAKDEMKSIPEFDYLVINDDLEKAVERVLTIIQAEHCRSSRYRVSIEN
ncbi:MAG: guanylate kinase [Flexilinea sp.]